MLLDGVQFILSLSLLLTAARFFTLAAEKIGTWMQLPSFVVGIFIVGIGTSLPELIAGIISTQRGLSEIVPGNVIGANISNILLITGLAVVIRRTRIELSSRYIYIDLNFLISSFFCFYIVAHDGRIDFLEASVGLCIYLIYSVYLIKGAPKLPAPATGDRPPALVLPLLLLVGSGAGIYLGAELTVAALGSLARQLQVPSEILALTLLSLGTTLPELAVNVTAIRQGKEEMALGNVLGSCVFNTLVVPPAAAAFGTIAVPAALRDFSLPVMAGCGVLFYLLTQDKKISIWEGMLFIALYALFLLKLVAP